MLEGKTQTPLEWPQSVALAAVGFEKKKYVYRSLTAGRNKKTDNHQTEQHAKHCVVIPT